MIRQLPFAAIAVAIFAILLTACHSPKSNDISSNSNQSTMDSTAAKIGHNKQLVRLWLEEGWNKNRNEEVVAQVFSKDWVTTSAALENQPTGTEGAMYWVHEFRKVFGDVHFTITHLVADENYVTARFEATGKNIGTFLGIPPTNKQFKYSGMVIHQVTNGLISKTWTEFDLFGLKAQLEAK